MQFNRLKLSGFKSFVEPTELLIETGLTGIVGPNGCGKSNLVEALRWVMGETSAKRMRGGEMDDVIFAGTTHRPARNVAEVVLALDNSDRQAPAVFNDHTDIEVSRRIDRGSGSNYRVNGREVRARDVQLLFADAASGARSTALVSQGQIGELIGAKPTERRHLLEEAAGITGLHSRRHEAELRLRAAETNLDRLEDVIATLETQMQALKRQSRQAARYRSLSGRIRKAEAGFMYRRWAAAQATLAEATDLLATAVADVATATALAARAATAQAETAATLPDLRSAEATAAAALHRLEVASDEIDAEERRLAEATEAAEAQRMEIEADRSREGARLAEAQSTLVGLEKESAGLALEQTGQDSELSATATALETARQAAAETEQALTTRTEQVASEEARRGALERVKIDLTLRLATLDERLTAVATEKAVITARLSESTALTEAQAALEAARKISAEARGAFDAAHATTQTTELVRSTTEAAERAARDALREAEIARERCVAETGALNAMLTADQDTGASPVVDDMKVAADLALALAAALGDDLLASTDAAAPAHWRTLAAGDPALPLPDGVTALATLIEAPPALRRRFDQIGLVERGDGADRQGELRQGQRLVSREGDLWRWDGFTAAADAQGGAAARLRQRQRLDTLNKIISRLDEELAATRHALTEASGQLSAAGNAYRGAREAEIATREAAHAADQALDHARESSEAATKAVAEDRSRSAALEDAAERLDYDRAEGTRGHADTVEALAAMPSTEVLRRPLDALKQEMAARRAELDDRFRGHESLKRGIELRAARLNAIAREAEAWRRRADDATAQADALDARRKTVLERLEALRERPAALRQRRAALDEQLDGANQRRRDAADALAVGETALAEADQALKKANLSLAAAREENVRAEGRREQAEALSTVEVDRVSEHFDSSPEEILAIAEVASADALDDIDRLERQVERLHRERDTMGAVNLRAEAEATEMAEQIDTMRQEREDLLSAIAKLRGGIGSLNREGRKRLLAAFEEVNGHFQTLFERLFGGGKAHLALIGDDDPLEAGLEVMASPPGKRLQNLSLLSGGEKALAALALLFAVFLTKPAPICVLDEVDAPLDDHNVDRFCALLDEIAADSSTRFLVITHHRLTMARMHRLFGVTMGERGVSQLVSVDMDAATELQAAE